MSAYKAIIAVKVESVSSLPLVPSSSRGTGLNVTAHPGDDHLPNLAHYKVPVSEILSQTHPETISSQQYGDLPAQPGRHMELSLAMSMPVSQR